ncbi:cytochrome P450 [Micromonospora sp. BQ11]|uniref:cytochrome P450 n=1 Tax=Micromonospora sp. BQ11 TaxID=3452212 RepID=UPI003F8C9E5A
MSENTPLRFPLAARPGVALHPDYLAAVDEGPLVPVRLANGVEALLVTGHSEVRTVLTDPRFSREAWAGGTLFARKTTALALVTSDPPVHTRRRRAVQAAFTTRQAELAAPRIAELAERLLDDIEATGPPVDLISAYTTPLPYRVICELVGVPLGDIAYIRPLVDVMMSAGRFTPDQVGSAHDAMYTYFFDLMASRRERPADDLLSTMLASQKSDGLTDEEIAVLAFGLVIAGGETTANHLAMCILQVLRTPGLAARLRDRPQDVPAAVEELLRWVWFAGTGGQPHVALADTELAGIRIKAGQVVIPMTDGANRDPMVFTAADEFRPDREPNPHLGFGHGRHLCVGAPHARVELQSGLSALLRRLDGLALTEPEDGLDWRDQMFLRGVWKLPVTWASAA